MRQSTEPIALGRRQYTLRHRRWFQFSLRTMFVIVTLVSIALAWVGHQMNWIRQRRATIESGAIMVFERGGTVWPGGYEDDRQTNAPGCLRIFGEQGAGIIFLTQKDLPADVVERLFPEAEIVDLWAIIAKPD